MVGGCDWSVPAHFVLNFILDLPDLEFVEQVEVVPLGFLFLERPAVLGALQSQLIFFPSKSLVDFHLHQGQFFLSSLPGYFIDLPLSVKLSFAVDVLSAS